MCLCVVFHMDLVEVLCEIIHILHEKVKRVLFHKKMNAITGLKKCKHFL